MRKLVIIALLLGSPGWAQAGAPWQHYEAKDFFALRAAIATQRETEPERLAFLRAVTSAAFGQHRTAVAQLKRLLRNRTEDPIRGLAMRLLMREERALGDYPAALAALEPLLPHDAGGGDADIRNTARLLQAIADVAPQSVARGPKSDTVRRDANGRFDVTVGSAALHLGFDTGANFSILARSVAVGAGLSIRTAGIALGSSNGVDASAEIAVGDIAIGPYRIRNVVFLILPDASLTMPDGFFMPGLLGFPVLAALGDIRYRADGSIRFEAGAARAPPNLALDGSDVLLRVGYGHDALLCRLDTGADNTVFYEPFYRRFPDLFGDPSRKTELKLGGVSGAHDIPAYKLDALDITLAGKAVHLRAPNVLTEAIFKPEDNHLDCNIGMDALTSFGSYAIDLKRLRLEIGEER